MSFYIALVNAILAVIMMIFNWRINRSSILLGLLILFLSSYAIVGYIVTYSHSRYLIAIAFGHFAPLWYLVPPLLYIYVRSTIKDHIGLTWRDLIHLIPFLVSLIGLFPYLISSFQAKLEFADEIIKNINAPKYIQTDWILPFEYKLFLKPILMIFYCMASILLISNANNEYSSSLFVPKNQWKFIQKWLLLITSTLFIMSVPALLVAFQYSADRDIDASLVRNSLFFNLIDFTQLLFLVILILYPQIIYGLPIIRTPEEKIVGEGQRSTASLVHNPQMAPESHVNHAEAGSLEPDPFFELGQKILKIMKEKKPYMNVDFSLDDLATILKVPKHHLYYCFQNILHTKFTAMRTEYRIEHAKKLLTEVDFRRVSLDSVGREAGFASKSAFYNTFKSVVGVSPGEYARASTGLDSNDFSE